MPAEQRSTQSATVIPGSLNMSPPPASKPRKIEPRGLQLEEAADYVGVGVTHFLKMVDDGRMPPPRMMGWRRQNWDRVELDAFFDRLPHRGSTPDLARVSQRV